MKRALTLLALLVASFPVLAQPLQIYYADDLEQKPGIIYVAKGFNTILQFYDRFDAYTVTRGEVVQVQELDPSTLWFYTTQSQGVTGMTVMINGRILQFTVVVRPGDYNRTYRVDLGRSVYATPTQVPAPTPPQNPAPSKGASETPSFELNFRLVGMDGRNARVGFTAKNLGKSDLYLDVARLRILQGGNPVTFSITRTPARVRLSPGETQTGTLFVRVASTTAPLQVEWTLTTASGESTTVRYPVPIGEK